MESDLIQAKVYEIDFIPGVSFGLEFPSGEQMGFEAGWGIVLHLFIIRIIFAKVWLTEEELEEISDD